MFRPPFDHKRGDDAYMRKKTYKITYAPNLSVSQKVVNPYDPWDSDNVGGKYFYSMLYNLSKEYEEYMTIVADSKDMAKSLFAIKVYESLLGIGIEGGYEPYIYDRLKNIKSIEEVSVDE